MLTDAAAMRMPMFGGAAAEPEVLGAESSAIETVEVVEESAAHDGPGDEPAETEDEEGERERGGSKRSPIAPIAFGAFLMLGFAAFAARTYLQGKLPRTSPMATQARPTPAMEEPLVVPATAVADPEAADPPKVGAGTGREPPGETAAAPHPDEETASGRSKQADAVVEEHRAEEIKKIQEFKKIEGAAQGEPALPAGDRVARVVREPKNPAAGSEGDYAHLVSSGWEKLDGNKLPAAAAEFRRALNLKPRSGEALIGLGMALEKNSAQAAGFLERGLAINPKHARGQIALGVAYQHLDRTADAIRAYEAYLALDPNGPEAVEIRAVIARLKGDPGR